MKRTSHFFLVEYSKLINQILNSLQDMVCVINKNWKIIKCNISFVKFFGKDIRNKDFRQLFSGLVSIIDTSLKFAKSQNGEYFCENSQKWLYYNIYPFETGLVVVMEDITEKKLQEQKLQESEFLLKAILDSTSDTNILVDREGRILCFNKAAYENILRLYGKIISIGQNMLTEYGLPTTRESLKKNFLEALSGKKVETERLLSFPNGEQVWVNLRMFPVFDETGNVWAVAFNYTNIHELKSQYEKLEEIAHLQSHIIRRPVASILGLIDLIDWQSLTPENQKIVDYLKEATKELDFVIRTIVGKTY